MLSYSLPVRFCNFSTIFKYYFSTILVLFFILFFVLYFIIVSFNTMIVLVTVLVLMHIIRYSQIVPVNSCYFYFLPRDRIA